MRLGEETWKWALVFVLLGLFILVGNQAYKAVNNPEDQLPPPDDYLKGDSYDQEHGLVTGPGSGQPVEVPATVSLALPPVAESVLPTPTPPLTPDFASGVVQPPTGQAAPGEPDWSQIKDPGQP
jgi:hypothetical protein